ncbi:hypothetical protein VitviT2T_003820 [Vitis vinifera]|uniref:Putative plant transposon protein domain-containing protein n=1 Tax=Vitis vinifera TaxID=29760 RepID=A0ABY9BN87_VITVI|nr:hypothetical protein VitviT2T_003820 [Vitis vinifera]
MAPRRESAASRAQGKRPAEPSQPDQSEARRKARYDTALFGSVEDYQRYKQKFTQRKVVPGKSINFSQLKYFGFEEIFGRMRWLPVVTISEPIFPTLIRIFYSRVTYGVGGPITSTVREVEITLSPESICRIFDIPSVGLRVYESKVWPTVPKFEPREAIQRLCGLADAQGMGKPSAHSLTMISRILHHMVYSILLPRGGHRDEVSYLEAFIVDSILTGRRIHVRRAERPPAQAQGQGHMHYVDEEEAEIREMEGGLDPQRDFVQSMPECDIPPPEPMISEPAYTAGPSEPYDAEIPFQAPHTPDHAPWMDLSAQIISLGTRMEELAVVNDTRFHSMEDCIDEYQTSFTSQFEHLDQRLGRLEERMDQQHEEMMAYLRSVFPPPPP